MTPHNDCRPAPTTVLALAMLAAAAASAHGQPAPAKQANVDAAQPQRLLVYIGTYTNGASKGIYCYQLDLASGNLTPMGVTSGVRSPSFLAIHPSRKFLYAVSERGDAAQGEAGGISAFALNPANGELAPLNQQSSGGAGPCHLVVDSAGKNVLAANYGGGSVVVLPIAEDGSLREASALIQHQGSSVHPQRQAGPHAHSINLDAGNRFAFAADLGLDKVLVYRFDAAQGKLAPHDPPAAAVAPGAGPRHFAFHPSGRFAYVINEMQSTVTAFSYDADRGVLTDVQTVSTLPQGFDGRNSTAEVQVHPSGKFLYGSNRGHDSLAIFSIDPSTGRLTPVGHQPTGGKTPRNFGIDPTGGYLLAANQATDTVVVFRVDQQTGKLEPTGVKIDVPSPVCVKMVPIAE